MRNQEQEGIVYELRGDSRRMAMALENTLSSLDSRFGDIEQLPVDELLGHLQREAPNAVTALGLNKPVTEIQETPASGILRARQSLPRIYRSGARYFLIAPVDYKGGHFRPEHVKKPGEKKMREIRRLLSGWHTGPVFAPEKTGVPVPADFDPALHKVVPDPKPDDDGYDRRVWRAQGASLHVVQDFLRRRQEREEAMDALRAWIKDSAKREMGEGFSFSPLLREIKGKMRLILRMHDISNAGADAEAFAAGSGAFAIVEKEGRRVHVAPDLATEAGRKFSLLLSRISVKAPDIGDCWLLWNPTAPGIRAQFNEKAAGDKAASGFDVDTTRPPWFECYKKPHLASVGNDHYLIYAARRDAPDYSAPRDAVAVDTASCPPALADEIEAARKSQKLTKDVFVAAGASKEALDRHYKKEADLYQEIEAVKIEAFGSTGDDRNILGSVSHRYGSGPEPALREDGTFLGFRFSWEQPGQRQSALHLLTEEQYVPRGWIPVSGHPGIYEPDPNELPELSRRCRALVRPSLRDIPEICGDGPIIEVEKHGGSWPRFYEATPAIDRLHDGYYIHMPTDYCGDVRAPKDALPLSQTVWGKFQNGNGEQYEPDRESRRGALVPEDYRDAPDDESPENRYYILRGRSLTVYRIFLEAQKEARFAHEALMNAWGVRGFSGTHDELSYAVFKSDPGPDWKPYEEPEIKRETEEEREARMTPDELDEADYIEMLWEQMAQLNLPGDDESEEKKYTFDLSTPEGRSLRDQYAGLPRDPDLRDLQARLMPRSRWKKQYHPLPRDIQIEGKTYHALEYPAVIAVPPQDAIEIPARIYRWHQDDSYDRRITSALPGLPDEAIEALNAFGKKLKEAFGPQPPPDNAAPPPGPSP
jgi:hypothetical protein